MTQEKSVLPRPSQSISGTPDGVIDVRPIMTIPYGNVVFVLVGNSVMSKPPAERSLPDHMYVDVGAVARKTSLFVILLCVFVLAVYGLTGFMAVHPFVALSVGVAAASFYFVGRALGRHDRI